MGLARLLRRRASQPLDPSFGALIGDLRGPVGRIDPHGAVALLDRSWSLAWAVRVGDGWRVASRQRAVRQSRVDDTPVYETWMRVPGGDVVQRVAVVTDGEGRALLVEYENASPDAVVVATIGHGAGRIDAELGCARLDGTPWMRPSVDAGAVVAGPDPLAAVLADPDTAIVTGRDGVGLLVPVPHRQKVSVLVSIEGRLPTRPVTVHDVAAGWRAVTADALDLEVPDEALGAAWRRIVGDLVLAAGDTDPLTAGEAAPLLDLAGLTAEADRARTALLAVSDRRRLGADEAVVALRALASGAIHGGWANTLAEVAGPLARVAGDQLDVHTARLVACGLAAWHPEAAADARRVAETCSRSDRDPVTPVAVAAATVLAPIRRSDQVDGPVAVLPDVPEPWLGQPIDIRNLHTGDGVVSLSVRWHGERPAVLWERVGGPDGVELRCPGLDPSWSTTDRQGEALLGRR